MKYLVCGEALIDLIQNGENSWVAHHGGGPFNTAKALAYLGEEVEFLGRLSTDTWGRELAKSLDDAGVKTNFLVSSTEPTSLAVVELSSSGGASYSFYLDNTSNFSWQPAELPNNIADFDLVHIGTLALVIAPSNQVLFNWFANSDLNVPIMVDLNVRPSVISDSAIYLARLIPWLQLATIVKASEEDLSFIFPGLTWQEAAGELMTFENLALVAVTSGANGAHLLTRNLKLSARSPKVEVVDTVGAGDVFSAGLITQLGSYNLLSTNNLESANSDALQTALNFAVAAAAVTCTKSGAQSPSRSDVMSFVDAE